MQLLLLTFVIGVLNLCLGYAIGVYVGQGPPTLWDALEVLRAPRLTAGTSSNQFAAAEVVLPGLNKGLDLELDLGSDDSSHPDDAEEESDPVVEPELSDLDGLRRIVDEAASSLNGLATRLKRSGGDQDGRTGWSFVGELQEICEPYMRHLSDASERLCDEVGDSAEATALGDEVQRIILEQVAQLETTVSNLQYMDFDSACSTAMKRLRTDTENTLTLAHRLQEALQAAPATTDEQKALSAAE